MAALGSGINAGLGRIDYSPIARGGEAAARGIMGAANTRAQGVMAIGQGISQGIQKFQQKKEEKKMMENAKSLLKTSYEKNKPLFDQAGISPGDDGIWDDKELSAGIQAAGGPTKIAPFLQSLEELKLEKDKQASEEAYRRGQIELQRGQLALRARELDADQNKPPSTTDGEKYLARMAQQHRTETGKEPTPGLMDEWQFEFRRSAATIITMGGQNSFNTTMGEETAKGFIESHKAATQAVNQRLPALYRNLDILKQGQSPTGLLAPITGAIDDFLADVGNKKAMERATDRQILDSALGSRVFEAIQSLGISARGMDTPAEREFIRKVLTGKISFTKEALIGLAEDLIRQEKTTIRSWNKSAKEDTMLINFYKEHGSSAPILEIPEYVEGQYFSPEVKQQNPEVRYDAQGNAFTLGENGYGVPYNP